MSLDPRGMQQLNLFLTQKVERAAEAAAAELVNKLSQPGHGIHWPGNPNPSSLEGAYPAAQTEHMVQSIDVQQVGPLAYAVGSFAEQDAEGYAHTVDSETKPPDRGGRFPITMAMNDPDIHAAAFNAIKEG